MALFIGAAAMAQATPHEKAVVRNDIARESAKRHDVARDIFRGEPAKARADHRAAGPRPRLRRHRLQPTEYYPRRLQMESDLPLHIAYSYTDRRTLQC